MNKKLYYMHMNGYYIQMNCLRPKILDLSSNNTFIPEQTAYLKKIQ